MTSKVKQKHVVIVGGGAAGMVCSTSLGLSIVAVERTEKGN
jgi:predicted flavoprotein YhiN